MYPLVVELRDRAVLVVGGGTVGVRKAATLAAEGAAVTIISDCFLCEVPDGITTIERPFQPGDTDGYLLVVAATNDGTVNAAIWDEARQNNTLCNVVDDRSLGDTAFAALTSQGPVRVAVTSSGAAPALSQWVRDLVARALPKNLAQVAAVLELERAEARARTGTSEGIDWRPRIEALIEDLGGGSDRSGGDGDGGAIPG